MIWNPTKDYAGAMTQHSHQTAPTQFVEANGIRFAYRRFGKADGVPIVFNQHYTGTTDYWNPAVTDGLARDREVILFNNAGIAGTPDARLKEEAMSKPKTIKTPGPDHPITIERNAHRVVVIVAGRVVADTRAALTLREAGYAPVQYIPRKDVDTALLERTDHATYCPYKGDCAYYSIPLGGERSVNAVWTYEAPYAAVAAIRDHVAFYPDRVDAIEERAGG